jgi:hypothetical protein
LNFRTDLKNKKDMENALTSVYKNHKVAPNVYSIVSEIEGKKPPQAAITPSQAAVVKQEEKSGEKTPVSASTRKTIKLDNSVVVEQSLDDFLNDL